MNPLIQTILISEKSTLPIIIDEQSALEVVRFFSGIHVTTLEECTNGSIPGVSLYEKDLEEDKKHLSVKDIRRWLSDIAEIPYEKKHIYILRDFDEATLQAMNATLKILEEPPAYAIILLIVKNPESLLETIRSRTVSLFIWNSNSPLSSELLWYIRNYQNGDVTSLVSYLYREKVEQAEASSILLELAKWADRKKLDAIETALISLFTVNESPRSILDRVIPTPF